MYRLPGPNTQIGIPYYTSDPPFQGQILMVTTTTIINIPSHPTGRLVRILQNHSGSCGIYLSQSHFLPIILELSETAAIHNSNIIASFDYDIESAIQSHEVTHLSSISIIHIPFQPLELSETAAIHNSNIIASFECDIESAIQSHEVTHLSSIIHIPFQPLELSETAAMHNSNIIASFDYDIEISNPIT